MDTEFERYYVEGLSQLVRVVQLVELHIIVEIYSPFEREEGGPFNSYDSIKSFKW